MSESINEIFGNKIRVRVCGLLFRDEKLLLIKHKLDDSWLWAPPGGGIELGETVEKCLRREFLEEIGIKLSQMTFLFFTEYIEKPLHAIELFYRVEADDINPVLGIDPELSGNEIIVDMKFVGKTELDDISKNELHLILKSCTNPIELLDKRGQVK